MRKKFIILVLSLVLALSACQEDKPEDITGKEQGLDEKSARERIEDKVLLELKDKKFLDQGLWGDFSSDGKEEFLIYLNGQDRETGPCFYLFTENSLDKINIDHRYADYRWEKTFTNDKGSVLVLSNNDEEFPQVKLVTVMGTNIKMIEERYPIVSFKRQANGKYQIKYVTNDSLFELQKYDPREADLLEIKEVTSDQVTIQDAYVNLDVGGLISHGGQAISLDQFRKYEQANKVLNVLEKNNRLVFSIYRYANNQVVLNLLDLNGKGFVSYIRFDTDGDSLSYANDLEGSSPSLDLEEDLTMEDLMDRSFRGAKSNILFPLEATHIEKGQEKINIEDLYELERLLVDYPYFAPYYWQVDNNLVTIPLYYKKDDKAFYKTISYEKEEGDDPRFYVVAGDTKLAIDSDERSRVKNLSSESFYENLNDKDRDYLLEKNFLAKIGQMEVNLKNQDDSYVFLGEELAWQANKASYKSDLYKGIFYLEYRPEDKYEIYFTRYGSDKKIKIGCGKSTSLPRIDLVKLENETLLEMVVVTSRDKDGRLENSRVYYSPNLSDTPREYKYFEPMYFRVEEGELYALVRGEGYQVRFEIIYNIRQNRLAIARPVKLIKET